MLTGRRAAKKYKSLVQLCSFQAHLWISVRGCGVQSRRYPNLVSFFESNSYIYRTYEHQKEDLRTRFRKFSAIRMHVGRNKRALCVH